MTRQGDKRVLAKSLHTATVLVRVAIALREREGFNIAADVAVYRAIDVPGLAGQVDAYGLAEAAIATLTKGAR